MKRKTRRLTALAALRLADEHTRFAASLQRLARQLLADDEVGRLDAYDLDWSLWDEQAQHLGCHVENETLGEFMDALEAAAEELE